MASNDTRYSRHRSNDPNPLSPPPAYDEHLPRLGRARSEVRSQQQQQLQPHLLDRRQRQQAERTRSSQWSFSADSAHLQNQQQIYDILQTQQRHQQEILKIIQTQQEQQQRHHEEILKIIQTQQQQQQRHHEEILTVLRSQQDMLAIMRRQQQQ